MRRICVVSLLIVSVVALGLAPANAAKPQIDRSGVTVVDLHFPAGALCDFALDVHQVLKTKLITFVDANGDPTRAISTGRIHVWETNADTGRHVVPQHLRAKLLRRNRGAGPRNRWLERGPA